MNDPLNPKAPQLPIPTQTSIKLPHEPKAPAIAKGPAIATGKQTNWVDKMGTSIMRGEMRQGQQLGQQSNQGINKIRKEAGEDKPLKPALAKLQRHDAGSRGTGKPDAPVKVHDDYKMPKSSTTKTAVPDSLLPPNGPVDNE